MALLWEILAIVSLSLIDAQPGGFVATVAPSANKQGRKCTNADALDLVTYTVTDSDATASDVFALDYDQDGDTDVVAVHGPSVIWWENEGGDPVAFTPTVVTSNLSTVGASAARVADLDEDLRNDVVVASGGDSTLAWYRFDGQWPYSFTKHVIDDAVQVTGNVPVLADLNDDGLTDIVAGTDTSITYYQNQGLNSTTGIPDFVRMKLADHDCPGSLAVADLNRDGPIDLILASECNNRV